MLWQVIDGTALTPGAAFFPALVNHLAAALSVRYVFVAECTDDTHTRVRTLAFWSRDTLADNVEFDLSGTPCEAVITGQASCYTHDLQTRFPRDSGLVDLGRPELSRRSSDRNIRGDPGAPRGARHQANGKR